MATSFKFFHDAALTSEVTSANPIQISHVYPGGAASDVQLWLGCTDAALQTEADSDPGVDDIEISISDADGGGTGNASTAVKLATSQGGLAGATAGAALAIGPRISGGVAGAFAFWLRFTNAATAAGAYTDIGLLTNTLRDSPA